MTFEDWYKSHYYKNQYEFYQDDIQSAWKSALVCMIEQIKNEIPEYDKYSDFRDGHNKCREDIIDLIQRKIDFGSKL